MQPRDGGSGQSRYQICKAREIIKGVKSRMAGGRLGMFQRPGAAVGHIHAIPARRQHRQDIGFQRIADHQRLSGPGAMAREKGLVDSRSLFRHDLNPMKQIAKARLREFAFLVQEVAFGDQDDMVRLGQCLEGSARVGQKIDRVGQHVAPCGHQIGDDTRGHAAICDLNRGLDHRQYKAFDAVAIGAQIAPLGGKQTLGKVAFVGVIGQQGGKAGLRQGKHRLIVPKRVVGIKTDGGKGHVRLLSGALHGGLAALGQGFGRSPFLTRNFCYIMLQVTSCESLDPRHPAVTQTPFHMSDKPEVPGNDTGLLTKAKPKTARPPMYKVMLLNDDYTPMEFVVHVLERFFGMTHAQSFDIMLTVHKKGLAVVGVFSHEVAETKVAQVMDFTRRHQHPLQCTMEKE